MDDCIFCKIIKKEIPGEFLHEDEYSIVIKDLYPKAKTHLLILPKKHIPSVIELEEGDEKIAGHMIKVAKDLAEKLGLKGYKLQINVGKDGGQEVFHLHLHLLSQFS